MARAQVWSVYFDGGPVLVLPLRKRLRVGDHVKLDGKPFSIWYIEEKGDVRNARAEPLTPSEAAA